MQLRALVVVALAVVALAFGRVRADAPLEVARELERARALEAQLEYDQALAIIDAALAAGRARPAEYVELHLLAGRLAAGLDKPDLARDHFARVLALRPSTTLPDGTSPKLTVPFAAAKLHSTPLALRVIRQDNAIWLDGADPLDLAVGISVTARGGARPVVERSSTRIAIPAAVDVFEVAALDAAGNQLWIGAAPVETPLAPAPSSTRHLPLYARWQTYVVAGGLSLAFAGVAAWRFQVAQDDWNALHDQGNHDFSELEAIESRGRHWGLAANVGFGVAAASAVTAIILGVNGRGSNEPVVTATPGGIGLSGRF